ncbi:MAG: LysR substrate-binding domain-containing protein [Gammaproteobacteria bacterium]|nr:LysR substrate-binding domain-containing protein [Gammaproteobacteria bacterium]
MDLYRLNINLLVALDMLFAEKSVTQAAKKLFITQAAMSNNLQQLREIFKDELLLREKNHMILTSYAKDLQPKLHQVVEEVRSLVTSGQRFDPMTSQRIFRIGMSDYLASLILPKLLNFLEERAPGIKITVVSIDQLSDAKALENGWYDLAIGKQALSHASAKKHPLFNEKVVCIVNTGHALAKKKAISLQDYLSYQHVAVRVDNPNAQMLIDNALLSLGVERDVKIGLPFIVPMFQLIDQSTTLIGTMIESVALLHQGKYNFVIKPVPFEMPDIDFCIVWHQRYEKDQGHIWLRQQIIDACH